MQVSWVRSGRWAYSVHYQSVDAGAVLYMLQVYDRVLASRNETTLLMLTLMILGAYVFLGALELVRSLILVRIGAQLDMKMSKRVYTAAFEQNLKRAGGNAGQALQDLTTIRQFLTGQGLLPSLTFPGFPSIWRSFFFFIRCWAGLPLRGQRCW